jgi:hypothetical protein
VCHVHDEAIFDNFVSNPQNQITLFSVLVWINWSEDSEKYTNISRLLRKVRGLLYLLKTLKKTNQIVRGQMHPIEKV